MNKEEKLNLIKYENIKLLQFKFTNEVMNKPNKCDYYHAIIGNEDLGFMPYPLYLDIHCIYNNISMKHFKTMDTYFNLTIIKLLSDDNIICQIKTNNGYGTNTRYLLYSGRFKKTDYLKMKAFKNGNVHIYITNKKSLESFNNSQLKEVFNDFLQHNNLNYCVVNGYGYLFNYPDDKLYDIFSYDDFILKIEEIINNKLKNSDCEYHHYILLENTKEKLRKNIFKDMKK